MNAALHAAALPFVTPWKTLDPALEVVTLDPAEDSWRHLLAGQGIALRTVRDSLPQGCAVATGFGLLDRMDGDGLGQWAARAQGALRPGGILVLGQDGSRPQTGLAPETVAALLAAAGFARCRVIRPAAPGGDTSLAAALDDTQDFAVVAQKAAWGRKFDVFSPVFARSARDPRQDRLRAAEAALHHRIDDGLHRAQSVLHDRITHAEADLRARLEAAEAALAEQRVLLAEMQRLTRRRGLRKLVHRLKQKWRGKPDPAPVPAALPDPVPQAAAPVAPAAAPAGDPVPLSPREAALRRRLRDPAAQE